MIRTKNSLAAGAGLAAALTLSLSSAAHADIAPYSTDAVGVGSDTVQNIGNFLADGDTGGVLGYNGAGNINRVFSFDATPDANDRAGYLQGSTLSAPKGLNPTVVLRAGTSPVLRPNGSGSGITALNLDKTAPNFINFVRSSRLPKASEQTTAQANLGTTLHPVRISTEDLTMAAATTTNAPAALTTAQLVSIYECSATKWTDVGGTSTNTIIPILPQSGSGTFGTFDADLRAVKPGLVYGTCTVTDEENDPSSITKSPAPADTIDPFSSGRKALFDSGYFKDPTVKFGNPPVALASGIQLLRGTGSYNNTRGLYIIFRDSDLSSTVPFQPGGTKNLVQTLFLNPGGSAPFVNSGSGRALITSGGTTPAFKDCGAGATTC